MFFALIFILRTKIIIKIYISCDLRFYRSILALLKMNEKGLVI